jgi:hypothetical protein
MDKLEQKIDTLLTQGAKQEVFTLAITARLDVLDRNFRDHDIRLRKLESSVSKLVAYASLFSALGSAIMTAILNKLVT